LPLVRGSPNAEVVFPFPWVNQSWEKFAYSFEFPAVLSGFVRVHALALVISARCRRRDRSGTKREVRRFRRVIHRAGREGSKDQGLGDCELLVRTSKFEPVVEPVETPELGVIACPSLLPNIRPYDLGFTDCTHVRKVVWRINMVDKV
jgi:hypothetical protein